jgi:DNA recombination protein RmuC
MNIFIILAIVLNFIVLIIISIVVFKRQTEFASYSELEKNFERLEKLIKDEISRNREEMSLGNRSSREETGNYLKAFNDSLLSRMAEISHLQKNQLDSFSNQLVNLTGINEKKLEQLREVVQQQLRLLQEDNSKKLEQMRNTVDEKLHATLEKRLGESFKLVSERLELVHKGLGEMQVLAAGVGDLKKVLANVKIRGSWGEIQLGNLLEQILTPQQYEKNVATKKSSNDRVEFAIKLPGKEQDIVWLPIDAKFPLEDYQKLLEAEEKADMGLTETMAKALELRLKAEAKDIKEKYLDPPHTTDFGILFLPLEGLYGEILRRPGLCEQLQNQYRVIITGPTTLAALLNSLQMGFRTLVIERRASEVWALLAGVKTEFTLFGDILDKTHKKLLEASNTIEDASRKSRTIERKLKNVQALPAGESESLPEKVEEII